MATTSTHIQVVATYRNRKAISSSPVNYQLKRIAADDIVEVTPLHSSLSTAYTGNASDYIYCSILVVKETGTDTPVEYILGKSGPTGGIQPPSAINALISVAP